MSNDSEFRIDEGEKRLIEMLRSWDSEGRRQHKPVMFLVRMDERNWSFFRLIQSGQVHRGSLNFDKFHKVKREKPESG